MRAPLQVDAIDGQVVIVTDIAGARDLADAWAEHYAVDEIAEATRRSWHDDVVALLSAAAHAEVQAGAGPEVVVVPLLRVAGDQP